MQNAIADFRAFLDELLIALAAADARAEGSLLDPEEVAKNAGLKYRSGWVTKAVQHFEKEGWIDCHQRILGLGVDGGHTIALTGSGLLKADELRALLTAGNAQSSSADVPAADRFVSKSDNEAAFEEAAQRLSDLAEAVRGANDLFADADERLAVERELEGLERLLRGAKVRAAAIWSAVTGSGVLRWLANHAVGGIVAQAATAAARALANLVGRSLPW
jgi:hypothetical protein